MNRQQIDVYVALPEGLYLYEAKGHILKPIVSQDIRASDRETVLCCPGAGNFNLCS